jgi:hypothetical protein
MNYLERINFFLKKKTKKKIKKLNKKLKVYLLYQKLVLLLHSDFQEDILKKHK